MRLRRFGEILNWKRSAAELALIVAGVLIALGANSWWEGRYDRQRELTYLQQILTDVCANELSLHNTIAYNRANQGLLGGLVRAVTGDALPAPDSAAAALRRGFSYDDYEPLTGSYTALVQSGDLQLMRTDSVRAAIVAYSAAIAAAQLEMQDKSAEFWRNFDRFVPYSLRLQPEVLKAELATAVRDPEFARTVVMQHTILANLVSDLEDLQPATTALKQIVEAELGPVSRVEVVPASANLSTGEAVRLSTTTRYLDGGAVRGCPATWSIADAGIVEIDDDGIAVGVAEGRTRVTAAIRGVSGSAEISVQSDGTGSR